MSKNFPSTNNASIVKFRNVTRRYINHLKKYFLCAESIKIHKNGRFPDLKKFHDSAPPLFLLFPYLDGGLTLWQRRLSPFSFPSGPPFSSGSIHTAISHFFAQGKRKDRIGHSYDRQSRNTKKSCLPQKYPTGLNYGRKEKKGKSHRKRVFQTAVHWPPWPRQTISRTKNVRWSVTYFFAAQLVERNERSI